MESKLQQLRGELISELKGFVKCNGVLDKETGRYEIPTYKGEDGVSINHNTEDVYCVKTIDVPAKVLGIPSHDGVSVTRVTIETNEDYYYADELYADDLEAILNYLNDMGSNDFYECRKWYDEYNGVA